MYLVVQSWTYNTVIVANMVTAATLHDVQYNRPNARKNTGGQINLPHEAKTENKRKKKQKRR